MKQSYLIIILLLSFFSAYSADPNWEVTSSNYQFSMTVSGVVQLDGVESVDVADRLAAWNGSTLRGTTQPFYVASTGRYYFFLTIYSNGGTENITFSFYDASADAIVSLNNAEVFVSDKQMGSFSAPYVFSNEFGFGQFKFKNVSSSTTIDKVNKEILVNVPSGTDITQLTAEYQFVGASTIKVNSAIQTNGTSVNNFTNAVVYEVKTTANETQYWTVFVTVVAGILSENSVQLSVYPNPVLETLFIVGADEHTFVEVYDEKGRFIASTSGNQMDCRNWPNGHYTIRMRTLSITHVMHCVKQ